MPLPGIPHQILITKAQELSGERAQAMKKNELMADQAAQRLKQETQNAQNRPLATARVEGERISADINKGGHPGYQPPSDPKEKNAPPEEDAESLANLPVEPRKQDARQRPTLDIKI